MYYFIICIVYLHLINYCLFFLFIYLVSLIFFYFYIVFLSNFFTAPSCPLVNPRLNIPPFKMIKMNYTLCKILFEFFSFYYITVLFLLNYSTVLLDLLFILIYINPLGRVENPNYDQKTLLWRWLLYVLSAIET